MTAKALAPVTHTPGAVRTNRAVLTVLGVLLLALGVLGVLMGLRVLGSAQAERTVVDAGVQDVADRVWFWPVVGAAGLLLVVLSAWWLIVQARTDRLGRLRLEDDEQGGRTVVDGSAITHAVEDEVGDLPGVTRASAHLSGSPSAPRLHLRVKLDGRTDPGEVHRTVTGTVLPHLKQALELDRLPTRVELDIARDAVRPLG